MYLCIPRIKLFELIYFYDLLISSGIILFMYDHKIRFKENNTIKAPRMSNGHMSIMAYE